MGLSFILYLIQKDLALAGSFADFLHRSNLAFDYAKARQLQIDAVAITIMKLPSFFFTIMT